MKRYYILHYIGQYLLLLILIIIVRPIYYSNFPIKQKVGPIIIKSNEDKKFNPTITPFLIAHFSDTHINSFNSAYSKHFEMCLNQTLIYQPDVFLHTGDIVDNFCSDTRPKYGHQCLNDFIEFNQIFQKYNKNFNISLVSAGNHDMFGIYSFDSSNFNFLNTCKNLYNNSIKNYEEFLVSNYKIQINDDFIVNFISLNPFTFPTAHPVLMYFAHTWTHFLDRLEFVIDQIPKNEKIVFYSHYPHSSFTSVTNPVLSQKSAKGRKIIELIERPNTISFISGHNHPKKPLFEHHGPGQIEGEVIGKNCQYIESIGFDVKVTNKFEIISIDNDRFVFHQIDPNQPNKCLITYPVPSNQTVWHSYMNDRNSKLRILCFDNDKPLKIEIHGDIEGETIKDVKKIREKVHLYEFPLLKLFEEDEHQNSNGYILHHLNFDGEWKGEIEFYSNGIVPQFNENKNYEYSRVLVTRTVLPIILIYLLYVTFPYSTQFFKKEEILYFDFLNSNSINRSKLHKNWILTYSGLCMRLKIQRLHETYRIVLFLAVLWPLFLPLSLMETEGHYGFIWIYGYYINGLFRYSEHGQDYALFYYIAIVLPVALASSSIGANIPFIGVGGLEASLLCLFGTAFVSVRVWYYRLAESAGTFCEFISVFSLGMIVLFPLMFYTYIELIFKNKNSRNSNLYSEGMTLLGSAPL